MEEELTKTNTYELAFWVKQELSPQKITSEIVLPQIQKLGGLIMQISEPKAKNLSYQIKREINGSFCVISFKLPQDNVKALEDWLKLRVEIIRFLITLAIPEAKLIKKVIRKPAMASVVPEIQEQKETFIESEIEQKEEIAPMATTPQEINMDEIDEKLKEILHGE